MKSISSEEKQLLKTINFEEEIILKIIHKLQPLEQWELFQIQYLFDTKQGEYETDWLNTHPIGIFMAFDIARETMQEGLKKGSLINYYEGLQKIEHLGESLYFNIQNELQNSDYQVFIIGRGFIGHYGFGILKSKNPLAPIIQTRTDGINYGLQYTDIVKKLEEWQEISSFSVIAAGRTA